MRPEDTAYTVMAPGTAGDPYTHLECPVRGWSTTFAPDDDDPAKCAYCGAAKRQHIDATADHAEPETVPAFTDDMEAEAWVAFAASYAHGHRLPPVMAARQAAEFADLMTAALRERLGDRWELGDLDPDSVAQI